MEDTKAEIRDAVGDLLKDSTHAPSIVEREGRLIVHVERHTQIKARLRLSGAGFDAEDGGEYVGFDTVRVEVN